MRFSKITTILFLLLLIFSFVGCSSEENSFSPKSEEESVKAIEEGVGVASSYIEKNGFDVLRYESSLEYTLSDSNIASLSTLNEIKDNSISLSNYKDKILMEHSFLVNKHPLDKYSVDNSTRLTVYTCEGKVLGGYSYPNTPDSKEVFSITGNLISQNK